MTSSVGWSADFQKGFNAYNKGDFATALREWSPLAEQGNVYAQYSLGQIYREGKGVTQDYKTAVKWYKLSAEQGDAPAQYNLGQMYRRGDGVLQNYKTAVKWYKLSAKQGNASAQINLGLAYALGKGVIQDNIYAHMWTNVGAANIGTSIGSETAIENRDLIAKKMTSADISTAQKLARECVRKKYKGC